MNSTRPISNGTHAYQAAKPEEEEKSLETGLRGVVAGICTTSHVDPHKGLSYVGKPIADLVDKDPHEVIYLLHFKKLPSTSELDRFKADLAKRAYLGKETVEAIKNLPKKGTPIDLFAIALSFVGIFEGKKDYREDCLNLIAQLPQIAALVINVHEGMPTLPPKPELGYMESFVHMISLKKNSDPKLTQVMRLFNVLHYDHSGGNLSAFVGKSVASGHEHMHGALTAAMLALAGHLHGAANQECLEFVKEVSVSIEGTPTAEKVEEFVRKRLASKELVFGFGHAVLRVEDTRATICYDYCKQNFPDNRYVKIAQFLRTEGSKVLKENPKVADPYPNVDAITGTMLHAAGFTNAKYYPVLFSMARCIGIAIQIVYEKCVARGGKGTPLMRPSYKYVDSTS